MGGKPAPLLVALLVLAASMAVLAAAEPQPPSLLRSWVGKPPGVTEVVAVSAGELIISDPADDQYKFYRPDWNWPITSDLDLREVTLWSDGANLRLRFKLSTLQNSYCPYIMVPIDFTPDDPTDGFSEWLPDWSDTRLPWKWDAIIGVNLGKGGQPFVFYQSWSPTFTGQLALDKSSGVIEAVVPLTSLPGFPKSGRVRLTVVVFANDYGGIWDPGKYNAYDPRTGIFISEDLYAPNVYDTIGLARTWDEVYGSWAKGIREVAPYVVVELSNGVFAGAPKLERMLSYANTLAKRTVIWKVWSVSDPADDQYKFYRPDWNWPITSDLDLREVTLWSDGANLRLRFKLSTLQNSYCPYIMVPIDFTPDDPTDGFSEWLPDWSDTRLPWKWDAIIGVNLGKGGQPFVFYQSWSPTFTGSLSIDASSGVIEVSIPLSALPGLRIYKGVAPMRLTVITFANSFGGIWDPGKNNAYDPATGKTITENDYASNAYDVAGQSPTWEELYGGWATGDYTVDTSFTIAIAV